MSDPTRAEAAAYRSAALGTIRGLHSAVKGRLTPIAAAFWALGTKSGADANMPVYDGWLPPITDPTANRFPFILVRPHSGTDSEQGADQDGKAAVDLIIGVFRDEDDGVLDLIDVIDAIRVDLAAEPIIAGTAFWHSGPLTWDLVVPADPLTSSRPEWIGVVTTNWTIPRPRRVEARNPGGTE